MSARRWWSGHGRLRPHPSGRGRPRSPKNDQTTPSQSQSRPRKSHPGCSLRRSPSLRRRKNQPRPRPKKKLLRHPWWKPGRSLWKSTGPRARHAGSGHRQLRSGGTGRVRSRGGRAARAGGGPRTIRAATHRTVAGAPSLDVTGGAARCPGPVPVPPPRQLRATARARRRPSQTSSKRRPRHPLCWRSLASARTRCSRSATTAHRGSRRSLPAALATGAPRGRLGEEGATAGPGTTPTGGLVGDGVARDLRGPPGPLCLLNVAAHGLALSHGGVEGRTGARPRGTTTIAGEASVLGGGTGGCRPRGKSGGGCTLRRPTGGRRTGPA